MGCLLITSAAVPDYCFEGPHYTYSIKYHEQSVVQPLTV